jgi:hypothetical protein
MSSLLMVGAAWAFFKGKDNTASIAAFSAGLILLGAWLTTALIDWHEGNTQMGASQEEVRHDDAAGYRPDDGTA